MLADSYIMVGCGEVLWGTLCGIVGVLIGTLLGHRLAIGRDRRREYNTLADKMFLDVTARHRIDRDDIAIIRRYMSWLKRWTFDRAIAKYDKAASDTGRDAAGGVFFKNPADVNQALARIAQCLKHK